FKTLRCAYDHCPFFYIRNKSGSCRLKEFGGNGKNDNICRRGCPNIGRDDYPFGNNDPRKIIRIHPPGDYGFDLRLVISPQDYIVIPRRNNREGCSPAASSRYHYSHFSSARFKDSMEPSGLIVSLLSLKSSLESIITLFMTMP